MTPRSGRTMIEIRIFGRGRSQIAPQGSIMTRGGEIVKMFLGARLDTGVKTITLGDLVDETVLEAGKGIEGKITGNGPEVDVDIS